MKRSDVINTVDEAFADAPRPSMFIEGTCSCDECIEHNETMLRVQRTALPIDHFGNPGWDPICFASEAAFQYLMPGLVRLVIEHPDEYIQQFLFHLDGPGRVACLNLSQRGSIAGVIELLASEETAALENNMATDDILSILGKLKHVSGGNG